jgi:hypothetical protein
MRALACIILASLIANPCSAQQDPGKAILGNVNVRVFFATNHDVKAAGEKATKLSDEETSRLQKEERLRYTHYRLLGEDTQPLYRSYENWAEPLKPSDEVMVRFEAQSEPRSHQALLDLELWLSRKKTIKTDARLAHGKPLYVLGPEWRGGRLIIAVSFINPKSSTP